MNKHIIKAAIIFTTAFASCTADAPKKATETAAAPAATATEDVITLTAEQATNAGVVTGQAEKRNIHTNLRVNGTIDVPPENIISVSIPLGGYIRKTTLLPGLRVSKGTVLATVEDEQYIQLQQDYLTAQSKLTYFEAEYKRQQQLNSTHATSDKVYQQALTDYESQRILCTSLAEKLRLIGIEPSKLTEKNLSRNINLYSPINGYVTKVNVNPGKYASPTDVLFELVNTSELHLTLVVFENNAGSIKEGQQITCYSNIHPEIKYKATVHLITPSIGKDRTTEVHCHINAPGKELIPGLYMNAEIELDNAAHNCLPEDAVVKWENETYIFSETAKNTYKMTKVQIGAPDEGFVPVLSELPSGNIVTRNAYALLSKLKNNAEE